MAKIQRFFYNMHIIEGMGYRDSHLLGEEFLPVSKSWKKLSGIVCCHKLSV